MLPMHTCSSANTYCKCYDFSSGVTYPRKPMSKDAPKFDRNTLPKKSGNRGNKQNNYDTVSRNGKRLRSSEN